VPVVLVLRVEDLRNITDERRAELIAYFDANNLPHVVTETHFVISSDLQHDNAFIQKIFDDLICPYLKKNVPDVTDLHVRSDGCKVRAQLYPP
jgi:UDP-N-acetylglucosamine transferase subunit ALG13